MEGHSHNLAVNNVFDRPERWGLAVELNLAMGLPCKFYQGKDYDITQDHISDVATVDDSGSMRRLKIYTQSDYGPIGGWEYDVLGVLLSLGYEQKDAPHNKDKSEKKIYFTYSEVCRRLGLDPRKNTTRVREAIEHLKSQMVLVENFTFDSGSGYISLISPDQRKPLCSTGKVKLGSAGSKTYQQVNYVTFETFVFQSLWSDFCEVVSSEDYLTLSSGPERRTYQFLIGKSKKFGPSFSFDLNELATVLGCEKSSKKRRTVGDVLKRIKSKINIIDFRIKQRTRGVEKWDVGIDFIPEEFRNVEKKKITFYDKLREFYGNYLKDIDLEPVDVKNFKTELIRPYTKKHGKETYFYDQEEIHAVEFAIDVALFQGFSGYNLTSVKGLAKTIISSMCEDNVELPDKYRYFLDKRLDQIKKKKIKEKLDQQVEKREEEKKEEEKRLEKSFQKFWAHNKAGDTDFYRKHMEYAEKRFEELQADNPNMGLLKSTSIESIAMDSARKSFNDLDFMEGDFKEIDMVDPVRELHGERASLQ